VKAYRFDVTFGTGDSYRVRCGAYEAGTTASLARMLVEAGLPDLPIEGGRAGKLDWTIRSSHRHAASTVSTEERTKRRDEVHPNLLAVADAMHEERERKRTQ
jgi:hypothetical protein